jgi:HlyD family secretion protein
MGTVITPEAPAALKPAPLPESPSTAPVPGHRARLALPLFLLALLAVAFTLWRTVFNHTGQPANVVSLSGRIEADDSAVASKASGRIREITVREGDSVLAGEIVARLDDDQIRAREQQAEAALRQADAQVEQARDAIAVLNQQLEQSRLTVGQSQKDSEGRVRQAEADLSVAEAQEAQAQANYNYADFTAGAYEKLVQKDEVSVQQAKEKSSLAAAQKAALAAAHRQVEAAKGMLGTAQATLTNPPIRSAQVLTVQAQIVQQKSLLVAAQADAARAEASLEEARANRSDLNIPAPFDGTVATRTAEPGEVVAAGTPILTVVNLSKVYLRGYIPEGQIGRVKLDQPARIYLDSAPSHPFEAYVQRIDPEATFTPENTYFQSDRVKQVVGVKLGLKSGFGLAKPGMPADGEILVDGNLWPAAPRKQQR